MAGKRNKRTEFSNKTKQVHGSSGRAGGPVIGRETLVHKRFGGFIGTTLGQVSKSGLLYIKRAGKVRRVRLRKGDAGKQVRIFEYSEGIAVVDLNNNLLKFVPNKSIPKPTRPRKHKK